MNEVAFERQADGSYKLSLPETTEVAEMNAGGASGVLGGLTKTEVWDIPIGQAAVGGFVAVVGSELVDGFMAAQSAMTKGLVKLAVAGASVKWGGKLLGSTGSKAVALLLAYDGIRMVLPIDEYASKVAGMFTKLTGGGLGGRAGLNNSKVLDQAGDVASSYYSSLSRRAG